MYYYLHHYFNPSFDYKNLKPKGGKNGKVDYYNLGYVQNVVKYQVIAEFKEINDKELEKYDKRFIYKQKKFPIGSNCSVNSKNPDQLISLVNGYVYYDEEGKISVKELLNIRGNVDFHTGNIFFVNNIVVHKDIKTDFEVKGNSILIKGVVEGAKIVAVNSIAVEGGIKGETKALLKAEHNIKSKFVESANLIAKGSILVETNCLHSNLYAGKNIMIRDRLIGGKIYCGEKVIIEGKLGGGFNVPTVLVLGYDPEDMYKFSNIEERLEALHKRLEFLDLKKNTTKDPHILLEIQEIKQKINVLSRHFSRIGERLKTRNFSKCKIIVKQEIDPGVEISIGPAYFKVEDFLKGTTFYFKDGEIVPVNLRKISK